MGSTFEFFFFFFLLFPSYIRVWIEEDERVELSSWPRALMGKKETWVRTDTPLKRFYTYSKSVDKKRRTQSLKFTGVGKLEAENWNLLRRRINSNAGKDVQISPTDTLWLAIFLSSSFAIVMFCRVLSPSEITVSSTKNKEKYSFLCHQIHEFGAFES